MYICPNCKATSEQPTNFCASCGAAMMVQEAPVAEQPVVPVEQPVPVAASVAPATEEVPVVEAEPVVTPPPAYQQPAYQQPAYQQQPQYQYVQQPIPVVQNAPSLGKVITGMALSIAGIAMAALGLLYTLMFIAIEGEMAFAFSLVMGLFSFPLSIVGFIMSKGNVNAGSTSAMSRVGKTLGLIGIILSGVMLFLGFVGFASVM